MTDYSGNIGTYRLINDKNSSMTTGGRLEFFTDYYDHAGNGGYDWLSFCVSEFDYNSADHICRILGYIKFEQYATVQDLG